MNFVIGILACSLALSLPLSAQQDEDYDHRDFIQASMDFLEDSASFRKRLRFSLESRYNFGPLIKPPRRRPDGLLLKVQSLFNAPKDERDHRVELMSSYLTGSQSSSGLMRFYRQFSPYEAESLIAEITSLLPPGPLLPAHYRLGSLPVIQADLLAKDPRYCGSLKNFLESPAYQKDLSLSFDFIVIIGRRLGANLQATSSKPVSIFEDLSLQGQRGPSEVYKLKSMIIYEPTIEGYRHSYVYYSIKQQTWIKKTRQQSDSLFANPVPEWESQVVAVLYSR